MMKASGPWGRAISGGRMALRSILTWAGRGDPAASEQERLARALGPKMIDQIPGTMLARGTPADLAATLADFPSWKATPEIKLSTGPVVRKLRAPAASPGSKSKKKPKAKKSEG
jgi:hypothetical protein